jgi:hypothetical protein
MKKIRIYVAAFTLASAALINPGYASAKTDNSRVHPIDGNVQFPPNRWRLVRQTFVLHLPRNSQPIAQIIIAVPSTVAVSNDIEVLEHQKGKKININVSVNGKNIILAFPEPVAPDTKLAINLNKVKQPLLSSTSVYRFSAKVVGSDAEISVGEARFPTD